MNVTYKISLFLLIILSKFIDIQSNSPTPLSLCTKGRISQYINFEKGTCGLGQFTTDKNIIGLSSYLFPAAINQDLFKNAAQCGICYELVGPSGAIRVRVEDVCSKDNELGLCQGDMPHFNVAGNGSSYVMGKADNANITIRMISCDYTGNIRILTDEKANKNYLSFVVLEHNIGVSFIEMKEYNSNIWTNITRSMDNKWTYYNFQNGMTFPLSLKIYSINGDYVTITMDSPEGNKYYEANNNFVIQNNNNNFFNISTLTKLKANINSSKCCERDKSDFTPIYSNGHVNGGYNNYQQRVTVVYNSTDAYLGKYSIKAKFERLGNLIFESAFPIRADQYKGVLFSIKANQLCNDCIVFRAYDINNNNKIISFEEINVWKNYTFSFDELGIINNEFNGIVFSYYKNTDEYFEVNIDKIELISNPNAPDAGICTGLSDKNNNNIIPEQNRDNNENTNNNYGDENNGNYIKIKSIIINENSPNVLNIKTDEFANYDNKKITLRLLPKNNINLNSIDINNCSFSNPYIINSFTCTLPSYISDGIYTIRTQTTNGFNFTYEEDVEMKNGVFICGNVKTKMNQYSGVYYSPLIIIYSKQQTINKGDRVNFDVYPIPQEEYNLDNDEMILLNNNGNKALYLKYCHQKIKNKIIYSIQCTVSNNIMKENYTNFYSNQIVSLLDGQTMNLIGSSSNGGMLKSSFSQVVSSDLTQSQKQNFNIIFDVIYYNSNIRPGDKFPHKIYLYGVKKYPRKLDDQAIIYDSQITFPNCTAGEYSLEEYNAIGSVICRVPDYVPAGNYSKLESDGIDVNPQNSVILVFEKDFNRSEVIKNNNEITNSGSFSSSSSSSSSKKWIIWLIIGLLAVILIGIVIVICICKKADGIDDTTEKKGNDSTAAAQNNNSSTY
jgi:hypothetical protein